MSTFAVTDESEILPALNYVLSNLDLNTGGGNGNANIPGNVLVANIQSGVINNYGNTGNAAPYWFLYQYINLRYGNSPTGTGFNTVSSNANYFGTFNSVYSTPSNNPVDYTWTQVAGGFGTANTIYYSAIGGRQVVWVSANSAPSTSFVESQPNVAINLDTVTTAAGTPGERGPVSMAYIVTPSTPIGASTATLNGWFTASPTGTPPGSDIPPIGTGLAFPVPGDIATFTYANGVGKPTATNTFNGSIWVPAYAQRIDGNVIVGGTLAANAIVANSITAVQIATESLTTDLFQANTINGNIIQVNTLNGNTIQANTISGNTIIANTFTANTINGNSLVIGSVSNTQIANGTITTNQIAVNTITANNIQAATITGNQIATNTITANNLTTDALTANTVVSTGATLGSFSSPGFWLQGNTGNARFGNTVSIGNQLTIGTGASIGINLNIGGNANIGANLKVGANANIANNLIVGAFATIGANLSVGGNIKIGNNANIGNNATIGGNLTIGDNLFVANLITTSSLVANTVNTAQIFGSAVSGGIGNTATTTINIVPYVFGTVYSANISSTITTIQNNQDVYLWSQVPYVITLGGSGGGTTWGSNVTVKLNRTVGAVVTPVFSQSYVVEQSVNQPGLYGQAVFCGFIDNPPTPDSYVYSMTIQVGRASGTWTPGQLSMFTRTFLIQTLKR